MKKMSPEMLIGEVKKIKELCGETVSISTHYVETDSESWESVVERDGFFESVRVVETLVEFVKTLQKCSGLSASELVNITHVSGGPWDSVDKDGSYAEISDSVILERHFKETELIK